MKTKEQVPHEVDIFPETWAENDEVQKIKENSFSAWVREYGFSKIAKALKVPRKRVERWYTGQSFPLPYYLFGLIRLAKLSKGQFDVEGMINRHLRWQRMVHREKFWYEMEKKKQKQNEISKLLWETHYENN